MKLTFWVFAIGRVISFQIFDYRKNTFSNTNGSQLKSKINKQQIKNTQHIN